MNPPFRVLLVDDNPMDRELVQRELGKEYLHLDILEAATPEQLEQYLRDAAFDVVITDYQLRWSDGLAVLHAVKQRKPNCPVIMFTGTGNEEVAVEAMKGGLDDYIVKSVEHLVRLRAAARSALERASASERATLLQSRLSSLLARLRVGVYRCWPNGRLLEANEALLRLVGQPPQANLIGRTLGEFFVDRQDRFHRWERLLAQRGAHEYETQLRRADGETIWVAVYETVSETPNGELTVEGLMEDISVRRRAEESLRRGEAEVAHIDRLGALAEMAASIAHEVNQPLSAIANFSMAGIKALEGRDGQATRLLELFQQISQQAQRAGVMVRRLRGFARRRDTLRSVEEVDELLRDGAELIAYEARRRGTCLEFHLAAPGARVFVDRVQIQQVLVNLLRNALDALEPIPPSQRRVDISSWIGDNIVEVTVRDAGVGLPVLGADDVFRPFVTTKPDGLGLGLAICATIIKNHGGDIWAAPVERGAAFHFTLPLAKEGQR